MWCKAEVSASLLQSSVSHDPLEIIIICWEEHALDSLMNNVQKNSIYFK